MDHQSKRKHSVEGKMQRMKSYAEILKTGRNTARNIG